MATQGPLFPGTTANLSNAGTSESAEPWVNPGNIVSDNGTEAQITAATYDSPDISQILVASNFGFSVVGTVDGITVEIDRRSIIAGSGADFRVQLSTGTAFANLVGTNKAATATTWPSTTAVATYGGAADTWTAGLTAAQVNASSFAVFLSCSAKIANADVGVDFIRVTVNYTNASVTATPGVVALSTATFSPTVSTTNNRLVTPSVATLTATGLAPTVMATAHQTVTPSTATLASSTFAPAVTASDHKFVTPGVLSVSLTPLAPTVPTTAHVTATPDAATLAMSAFAPTVATTAHQTVTPDTASLSTAGFEPTVTTTAHVTVEPSPQALALTAFAPDTVLTDHKTVTPDVAALTLTALTPNVTGGEGLTLVPGVASLSMTAFAPDIVLTDNVTVTPSVATLSLTGLVPSANLGGNTTVTPSPGVLTLTTFAPDLGDVPLPQALRLGLTFTRPESGMSIQIGHVGLEVDS